MMREVSSAMHFELDPHGEKGAYVSSLPSPCMKMMVAVCFLAGEIMAGLPTLKAAMINLQMADSVA